MWWLRFFVSAEIKVHASIFINVDVANYNSKFKLDTVLERLVVVIEESYLEAVVETKWHYHSRRQVQRLVPETVIIMFIIQIQRYLQNYYYDTFLLQNRNFWKKNPALFAFIKRKLIGLDFDIFCYFYKCGKSSFKHEQTHQDLLHIFYQMLLLSE